MTEPSPPLYQSLADELRTAMNDGRLAAGSRFESFRRALSLAPKDADIAHNLAWLLCQQRQYSEANALFNQVLTNRAYAGRAKSIDGAGGLSCPGWRCRTG